MSRERTSIRLNLETLGERLCPSGTTLDTLGLVTPPAPVMEVGHVKVFSGNDGGAIHSSIEPTAALHLIPLPQHVQTGNFTLHFRGVETASLVRFNTSNPGTTSSAETEFESAQRVADGGIVKLGSKLVVLQEQGVYTGSTVRDGAALHLKPKTSGAAAEPISADWHFLVSSGSPNSAGRDESTGNGASTGNGRHLRNDTLDAELNLGRPAISTILIPPVPVTRQSRRDGNDMYIFGSPTNPNSTDDNSHGTHVAGTIGAIGNNGVAGLGSSEGNINDLAVEESAEKPSATGKEYQHYTITLTNANIASEPTASSLIILLGDGSARLGGWGASMYQYDGNVPTYDSDVDDLAAEETGGASAASPTIAVGGYIRIKKLNSGG